MAFPFFYLPEPGNADLIVLDEANSKHAIAVLRMQAGEKLHLTDGKGSLLTAEIVSPHKKNCSIRVLENKVLGSRQTNVTIAISPIKNTSRLEWFMEKATEIGVAEIIPLICQRTEKMHFRYERMLQIMISAMLQSQQTWLPKLQEVQHFQSAIQQANHENKWIAHCLPSARQSLRENDLAQSRQILLVGPEGDFTQDEIQYAIQSGFLPVTLGETRLRTETAGMVGATLLCIR